MNVEPRAAAPHFHSILFRRPEDGGVHAGEEPGYFGDLNLNQILQSMTSGREEYQLAPFVDAVEIYCDAVRALADDLPSRQLASEGLNGLCGYLAEYVASPGFTSLVDETGGLREALGAILRDSVLIQGGRVTVAPLRR